jgi:hypothetical protein
MTLGIPRILEASAAIGLVLGDATPDKPDPSSASLEGKRG